MSRKLDPRAYAFASFEPMLLPRSRGCTSLRVLGSLNLAKLAQWFEIRESHCFSDLDLVTLERHE
jgi:hypothetical protein